MKLYLTIIFCIIVIFLNIGFAQHKISSDTNKFSYLENKIFEKIDSIRLNKKLSTLTYNDSIYRAAKQHSQYMANSNTLSHYQQYSDYKNPRQRMEHQGIIKSFYGENIASYSSIIPVNKEESQNLNYYNNLADEIIRMWVKSELHYKNICNHVFRKAAIAVSYDYNSGYFYVVNNLVSDK